MGRQGKHEMINKNEIFIRIKEYAADIGFDACGICKVEAIDNSEKNHLKDWLNKSYHADMGYMANHFEKRCDPTLLVEGSKSIVCVALNYYPKEKQSYDIPQIAYYAYGKDYHIIMKEKLQLLFDKIKMLVPTLEGRIFCDSAPVMERYWAAKAGLGFIGKNSLLILPKKGSYFFLGELILNVEADYDTPITVSCGNCTRCMEACPTKAISPSKVINSNKCISYQTIENKGEIDQDIIPNLNNRFYGCDICQQVCPWNKYAKPCTVDWFTPSEKLLGLSIERLDNLSVEEYQAIFKNSAVKRAKFSGLKRNLEAIKQSPDNKTNN